MFLVIILIFFSILTPPNECQRRSFSFGTLGSSVKSCDMPRLRNGVVRLRQRARFVTYSCKPTFTIIGSKHSACTNGKWDSPVPVCIKGGCSPIEEPEHSMVLPQYNFAALTLFCHSGYQRIGSARSLCDGRNWDRPLGSCREISLESETSCDFEGEDICGWLHDNSNDFVWKRTNGIFNGKHLLVGPSLDHTTGKNYEGYYMLMDMSEIDSGEKARLISPGYSANLSSNACFKIFYHMYGLSPGKLRVYMKPLVVDLEDALANSSYNIFEISGNQGNKWNERIFNIPEVKDEFQIVIEGVSTMIHGSHIAFDDVGLLQGENCKIPIENATESKDGVYAMESCANRCSENETTISGAKLIVGADFKITQKCDCFENCTDIGTCCPDYQAVCVDVDIPEEPEVEITTPTTSTTKRTSTSTSKPTTVSTTTVKTTQKSTTASITTTPRTTTSTIKVTSSSSTTVSSTKTTSTTVASTKIMPTKKAVPTKHKFNSDYETVDDYGSGDEEAPLLPPPTRKNPNHYVAPEKPEEHMLLVTVVSTLLIFAALVAIVGAIAHYRRKKFDPRNYKHNAEGTESATDEFSEVRFLTSDEQLDFTPQTDAKKNDNNHRNDQK